MLSGIQRKISIMTGISEGYVSCIVNGIKQPSWQVAKKIAVVTFTDPVLWLDGTPEQKRAALDDLEIHYTIEKKGNGQKKAYIIKE